MRDLRGFYDKFQVIRRETGKEITDATFTLIPARDVHAAPALRAYADSCEIENPALAEDLRELARRYPSASVDPEDIA
jgi:hypothetical protein